MSRLSEPDLLFLKIARKTMKMSCEECRVLGEMDHPRTVDVINKLGTGKAARVSDNCSCNSKAASNVFRKAFLAKPERLIICEP